MSDLATRLDWIGCPVCSFPVRRASCYCMNKACTRYSEALEALCALPFEVVPHSANDKHDDGGLLDVFVTDSNKYAVRFKMKTSTPLRKMMNAYCGRFGLQMCGVRFLVNGELLDPEDSVAKAGVVHKDVIETMHLCTLCLTNEEMDLGCRFDKYFNYCCRSCRDELLLKLPKSIQNAVCLSELA